MRSASVAREGTVLDMLTGGVRRGAHHMEPVADGQKRWCESFFPFRPEAQLKDLMPATRSMSAVRVQSFGEVLRLRLRMTWGRKIVHITSLDLEAKTHEF